MKVALLSDVHANAPALEAVLADLADEDVDEIVHAGDLIGYGPYPRDVIDIVRTAAILSIRGNHDRGLERPDAFREQYVPVAVSSLEWTREQLTDDDLSYLAGLALERTLFDDTLHVAHGAPGRPDEYVYPDDLSPTLFEDIEADVLVLGHTHVQVARAFEDGLVINPGSVGQPRDGDPAAAYAIVDLDQLSVSLRRVSYSVHAVTSAIAASGLPNELCEILRGS